MTKNFKWSDITVWEPAIRKLMADLLDKRLFAAFRSDPPEYIVPDDLSWLDDIITRVHGPQEEEVHKIVTQRIVQRYQFVTGFHACRAVSLDDYKLNGLRVCNPDDLDGVARTIFGNTPEVAKAIANLLDERYTEHNRGSVFLSLTMEHLVEACGQYLLYGSEYLLCIAARLRREEELRSRGRATVVECRVPIELIPDAYLRCLAGDVIEEIFERELDPTYRRTSLTFGFPIRSNIAPENILAFHHPRQIPNDRKCRLLED
jgi:hypothetical protein